MNQTELITTAYRDYYDDIHKYIGNRVKSYDLAEDLTQDVFVRLMTHADMLRQETIKSLVYTIARNIIIDHHRHHKNKVDFLSYQYDMVDETYHAADENTIAKELQKTEQMIVARFPPARRKVYSLYRHKDMAPRDISRELNMNLHAVYCQLFLGKKSVRDYVRNMCI